MNAGNKRSGKGTAERTLGAAASPGSDPMLAVLRALAEHHDLPFSASAALQGAALDDSGMLTIDGFETAAQRVGLQAEIVTRKPSAVPGLVCPFVLFTRDGTPAIAREKSAPGGKLTVEVPGKGAPKSMSAKKLDRECLSTVIYAAPLPQSQYQPAWREQLRGHWFWSVVRRFWATWLYVMIAALIINLLGLALPLFVMNVYDRVIPNNSVATLWSLAAGVVIAIAFDFLLRMLRSVVIDHSGRRIDMKVSSTIFEHVQNTSMKSRIGSAGDWANRVREFENVREFFTSASLVSIIDLLFIGIFLGLLWLIVGPLALVPIIALPILLFVMLLIQFPMARSVRQTMNGNSARHSVLVESLTGIETVKSIGAEGVMQRRWDAAVAGSVRAGSSLRFWSSFAIQFTLFVQQLVSVLIIIWGVYLIADGSITVGALVASNILAGRVLAPIGGIATTMVRAQQSFSTLRQLDQIMKLPGDHRLPPPGTRPVERAKLELRQLVFAYPGQAKKALDGVSLTISPGERVGIIGRVGSGKSTLGKVMCGLYAPDDGAIVLDGVDIAQRPMADVRRAIVHVGQQSDLFSGTLRENITFSRPHITNNFEQVCVAAGVASFANKHPLGYSMPVGEGGRSLSGGERQAVNIARGLMLDPNVLFLDEPTSSMDQQTEAAFVHGMKNILASDITLVVASHRQSILALVDRLIVLEAGKVIEDGPREKVIERLKGKAKRASEKKAQDARE